VSESKAAAKPKFRNGTLPRDFEDQAAAKGFRAVAGVDEAGRCVLAFARILSCLAPKLNVADLVLLVAGRTLRGPLAGEQLSR
jgi:hypothetical protein